MFYPELKGNPLEAYNRMVRKLYERASRELGLTPDDLVLRPLRPEDLGLSNPAWSLNCTSANAWNDVISTTVADARFIGISGVYHNEGAGEATQVKISREASDVRYWDITPIRAWENKIGYADDVVTLDQNTSVTISIYCTTASTLTDFAFIGAVVEKKGLLISPEK